MEHAAIRRGRRQALNPVALARLIGIAGGSEHHAERAAPVPFCLGALERTGERVLDELEQVGLQAHEDGLALRVSQPAVEFQRARVAGAVDHQPGVEKSDVGMAFLRHALYRRLDDFAHHARVDLGRDDRCRRIGAHAAGVRTLVAIAQPLVILARGERQHVRAVAHHDEARLLAFQELLHHHAAARGAIAPLDQHGVEGGVRLLARGGDHHAFAGGEAVGLDDDRRALGGDVRSRVARVVEAAVARGRQTVAHHEALGEVLGGLELRRCARRPKDAQTRVAKRIDDACGKRRLRPHQRELNLLAPAEIDQRRRLGGRDVLDPGLRCGAAVPRRDEHLLHAWALREFPGERVLASAAADDEKLH